MRGGWDEGEGGEGESGELSLPPSSPLLVSVVSVQSTEGSTL